MATGWNVMDALNKRTQAAAVDNKPKARFRTKDISINRMYSNERNFYSMPDIEQLAQDIFTVGLLENLTVVHDPCEKGEYRIIAGERRWRALKMLVERGYEEFEVASCQIKTPAEEHEEMVQLIIANTYRNKTVKDILEEEQKLKSTLQQMKDNGLTLQGYKLDSGRLRDTIADMMKMPATKIAQIESINKHLIPEFTEELKEGRLTFSAAYELSGLTEERQQEILEKYQEDGLTFKEVREYKKRLEEEKKAEQIEGKMELEEWQRDAPEEPEEDENIEEDPDLEEEYEDAHPEYLASLCYSCLHYSECNVKTGTCQKCDKYVDKAEAEKTEEQRYEEEQDAIDRETKRKLREREEEERTEREQEEPEQKHPMEHAIRVGASVYEDTESGVKTFELRKKDRDYRVGDILVMLESKGGETTGRACKKEITYIMEDATGIEDGYCILGVKEVNMAAEEWLAEKEK